MKVIREKTSVLPSHQSTYSYREGSCHLLRMNTLCQVRLIDGKMLHTQRNIPLQNVLHRLHRHKLRNAFQQF